MAGLKGKVALVTGGSKGLGHAICQILAARGASLVFTYLKSRDDANTAEKVISAYGGRVLAVRGNVGDPEHLDKLFKEIEKEFGHLDILVSNAALGPLKPAMDLTLADWARAMDINARAFLLLVQKAAPLMKGRAGKIVAITSQGSERYLPDYAAIGAAKAALESLVRYLAVDLAPQGVRVNAVCAGTLDTYSLRQFPKADEVIDVASKKTPAGRIGKPEDIAPVVAFLCSEESGWICGQTLVADGGFSLLA